MPDATSIDALHRLANQPTFIGLAIALIALAAIWAIMRVSTGQVETFRRAGESHVTALREISEALNRVVDRMDQHDLREETRHQETRESCSAATRERRRDPPQ